jgi:hypothetical protein
MRTLKEAVSRFKNKIKMNTGSNKGKLNSKYSTVIHISSPTNEQNYLTTGFTEYQLAILVKRGQIGRKKEELPKINLRYSKHKTTAKNEVSCDFQSL